MTTHRHAAETAQTDAARIPHITVTPTGPDTATITATPDPDILALSFPLGHLDAAGCHINHPHTDTWHITLPTA